MRERAPWMVRWAVALPPALALAAPGCFFHLDDVISAGPSDAGADSEGGESGLDADAQPEAEAQDGADAGCTQGERRCQAGLPQECDAAGAWADQPACEAPAACAQGLCVSPAASCEGLAATCGPAGDGPCCEAAEVPGGGFLRSYDAVSYSDSTAPATIAPFRLDVYEVTVGRFRAFVQHWPSSRPGAGQGSHPTLSGSGWDDAWNATMPADAASYSAALHCASGFETWTDTPGPNESRPINCVTWYDAFAFCAWDGGRLPTEAEWNFAASGGDQQRVYPWSDPPQSQTITPSNASYFVDSTSMCMGDGNPGCTLADLVPVGAKAAGRGRWGHADLGGNVMEWVLDGYTAAYPMPCVDCANLLVSNPKVMRGGCFDLKADKLLAAYRFSADPAPRYRYSGIRCAR